uniref:Uncharacterized protein n=1 Tax=Tetranychus urticae TaxID=32264 RepID=T1K3L4_TETUR
MEHLSVFFAFKSCYSGLSNNKPRRKGENFLSSDFYPFFGPNRKRVWKRYFVHCLVSWLNNETTQKPS